ncbi:tetraspanin-15 [Ananas comosus]|uniref:Tetraspanin-15 n=1 Tax=Ananas comosus TaxID=4615 RepID=A0A6P5EIY5_ANACO|nr:tetraspanin-15 [Ananas comosus]
MKRILRLLAVLASFVSLPALACGVWLLVTRDYDCEDLLVTSGMRVGVGVGLLGMFVVSNAAGYSTVRKGVALAGYAVLAVALVVALTMGLVLVGVYKMEARQVPASPGWFQTRLASTGNWNEVKSCLYNNRICSDLAYRTGGLSAHEFGKIKLSPVEAGCCKPPDECGMAYVSATDWIFAENNDYAKYAGGKYRPDCRAWGNRADQLCFNCDMCRDGFAKAVTSRWRKVGIFLIVISVLLIAVHAARFIILMSKK